MCQTIQPPHQLFKYKMFTGSRCSLCTGLGFTNNFYSVGLNMSLSGVLILIILVNSGVFGRHVRVAQISSENIAAIRWTCCECNNTVMGLARFGVD